MTDLSFNRTEYHEDLPPPASEVGIFGWLRHNFFSTWYNSIGTVAVLYLFYLVVPGLIDWTLISAVWDSKSNQDCRFEGAGACWGFIDARFNLFFYGFYDIENYWRPSLVGLLLLFLAVPTLFEQVPKKIAGGMFALFTLGWAVWALAGLGQVASLNLQVTIGILVFLGAVTAGIFLKTPRSVCALAIVGVFPWVSVSLLYGPLNVASLSSGIGIAVYAAMLIGGGALAYWSTKRRDALGSFVGYLLAYSAVVIIYMNWGFGLTNQATSSFGGLMLTLVLSTVAIGVSLPLGIMLALGRRADSMPAVQMLCIGFIELVRAVPLITILFMAQFMLPLFLPEGVNFDNVVRALVGVSMFASAYMAEVVRGGLQAIPKGQFEAADSLGLNFFLKTRLIIMPQALKIVIPGIVSTFIGLFKDTSLVSIIGLMDLLLIAKSSVTDAKWLGLEHEAYFFIALIYFVFCFGMSRYSIYLERKLHTGHKR
jgi:general L-amino acid transport system permease protein